jgi:hypothetical protein
MAKGENKVFSLKAGATIVDVVMGPAVCEGVPCLAAKWQASDLHGNILGEGCCTVDLASLRKRVQEAWSGKRLQGVSGETEIGSWSWDEMKHRAKRIAKRVGAKKLLRQVRSIANDPRFQRGAAMAAAIYPPFGIPYSTVAASAKLLEQVRGGDDVAQGKLLAIKQKAEAGDPKAQKVSKAIYAMNQAAKQGADVAGWAMNLPYRGNLEARSLDATNPGHKMRALYHMALSR